MVDTGEKDLGFLRHQVVPNRQILEIASGDQSAAGNPPLLFNNQHPKDRAVPSSAPESKPVFPASGLLQLYF